MQIGFFWLLVLLALFTAFPREKPLRRLSTPVSSRDWEVLDWSAVRRGQLGVVRAKNGDALHLYVLATTPAPVSPPVAVGKRPEFSGNCFQVSTFDFGNTNQLGGYFNAFQKEPSSARASLQTAPDGRRGLTLDFVKTPSGYCGVWTHLFDFKRSNEERRYFDATGFSLLTFWIRGHEGTGRILLKAADARWERKGDSLAIGETSSFLVDDRAAASWQRAVVPLSRFPQSLNRRELASLVFEPTDNGLGRVQIKDLAFCVEPAPLPGLTPPTPKLEDWTPATKALWVWNTVEILASSRLSGELLDFVQAEQFNRVFLQLPEGNVPGRLPGELTLDPSKLPPLLASLNHRRVAVFALDGFKNYALPNWHEGVLRTVDNVIRYNQDSLPSERFAGIHYDIEPYLLEGFAGPRRQTLLLGYLELLEKISEKTKRSHTHFGVDIPFWYDTADETTGQPTLIQFRGASKPASEHVIDLVDEVAIMDYRTVAYGADGVIAMAQDELAYAAKQGKPVLIGLETTDLPDEELVDFSGSPSRGLTQQAPQARFVLLVPGESAATLYLVSSAEWPQLHAELGSLGVSRASLLWWPVQSITFVPGRKLTFFDLGADSLRQTMAEVQTELRPFSSFAGFAIHDYLGYRRLRAHPSQTPQ